MTTSHSSANEHGLRAEFLVVCLAVLSGYTGQHMLSPVLPPLARMIGMPEGHIGLVLSISGLAIVLMSPIWGRLADAWGTKRTLVVALVGAAFGMLVFAVFAQLSIAAAISSTAALVGFAVSRGIVVGCFIAAVPIAGNSFAARTSMGSTVRSARIARIGACIGFGIVAGPGLGGVLASTVGIVSALYAAPIIMIMIDVVVLVKLPNSDTPIHPTPRGRPRVSAFDSRLLPFLFIGAGIYLSTTIFSLCIGFLVADRLHLTAPEAAGLTGLLLVVGGMPMLIVQGLVVPRLGWSPLALVTAGIPITIVGFLLVSFASHPASLFTAAVLSGLGHSLAIPGYTSAPTLQFDQKVQGQVAGLLATANAAALAVGPLFATTLYSQSPGLPFIAVASILAIALVIGLVQRISTAPESAGQASISDGRGRRSDR